jgi:hypothetical protein
MASNVLSLAKVSQEKATIPRKCGNTRHEKSWLPHAGLLRPKQRGRRQSLLRGTNCVTLWGMVKRAYFTQASLALEANNLRPSDAKVESVKNENQGKLLPAQQLWTHCSMFHEAESSPFNAIAAHLRSLQVHCVVLTVHVPSHSSVDV